MSKVITFSRYFQKSHPRAGEPTHFVEKIIENILLENQVEISDEQLNLWDFGLTNKEVWPKLHTIRAGNRFKVGDKFSPRVWSGKPYASKQIVIAPDLEVKQVYRIEIYATGEVFINEAFFGHFGMADVNKLAKNDGLAAKDFRNWFTKLPFKGQIICWSDEVNY